MQNLNENESLTQSSITKILLCNLCNNQLINSTMCPKCNKIYCKKCIMEYLFTNKNKCPSCKSEIYLSDLISIPFMNNLANYLQIQNLNQNLPNEINNPYSLDPPSPHTQKSAPATNKNSIICPSHKLQLMYYCKNCKLSLCSDCCIMNQDNNHLNHQVVKLDDIYKEKQSHIKKLVSKLNKMNDQFNTMINCIKNILGSINIYIDEKYNELNVITNSLKENIYNKGMEFKDKLLICQNDLINKQNKIKSNIKEVEGALLNYSKSEIINGYKDIIINNDINSNCVDNIIFNNIINMDINYEISKEVLPQYNDFLYDKIKCENIIKKGFYFSDKILEYYGYKFKLYVKVSNVNNIQYLGVYLFLYDIDNDSANKNNKGINNFNIMIEAKIKNKNKIVKESLHEFNIYESAGFGKFIPIKEIKDNDVINFKVGLKTIHYQNLSLLLMGYNNTNKSKLKYNKGSKRNRSYEKINNLNLDNDYYFNESEYMDKMRIVNLIPNNESSLGVNNKTSTGGLFDTINTNRINNINVINHKPSSLFNKNEVKNIDIVINNSEKAYTSDNTIKQINSIIKKEKLDKLQNMLNKNEVKESNDNNNRSNSNNLQKEKIKDSEIQKELNIIPTKKDSSSKVSQQTQSKKISDKKLNMKYNSNSNLIGHNNIKSKKQSKDKLNKVLSSNNSNKNLNEPKTNRTIDLNQGSTNKNINDLISSNPKFSSIVANKRDSNLKLNKYYTKSDTTKTNSKISENITKLNLMLLSTNTNDVPKKMPNILNTYENINTKNNNVVLQTNGNTSNRRLSSILNPKDINSINSLFNKNDISNSKPNIFMNKNTNIFQDDVLNGDNNKMNLSVSAIANNTNLFFNDKSIEFELGDETENGNLNLNGGLSGVNNINNFDGGNGGGINMFPKNDMGLIDINGYLGSSSSNNINLNNINSNNGNIANKNNKNFNKIFNKYYLSTYMNDLKSTLNNISNMNTNVTNVESYKMYPENNFTFLKKGNNKK